MIKFLLLENNIAYRVGVVDYIPDDIGRALYEFKVDRFITKDVYNKRYKPSHANKDKI